MHFKHHLKKNKKNQKKKFLKHSIPNRQLKRISATSNLRNIVFKQTNNQTTHPIKC